MECPKQHFIPTDLNKMHKFKLEIMKLLYRQAIFSVYTDGAEKTRNIIKEVTKHQQRRHEAPAKKTRSTSKEVTKHQQRRYDAYAPPENQKQQSTSQIIKNYKATKK